MSTQEQQTMLDGGASVSTSMLGAAVEMHVYSGECRLCDVGVETGFRDCNDVTLRTGDIVITYTVDQFGFANLGGLTVVVSDQYQSYSDGTHIEKDGEVEFFVMGIKSVDINEDGTWCVKRVKGYESVIDGEHWPDFGFSFQAHNTELTGAAPEKGLSE